MRNSSSLLLAVAIVFAISGPVHAEDTPVAEQITDTVTEETQEGSRGTTVNGQITDAVQPEVVNGAVIDEEEPKPADEKSKVEGLTAEEKEKLKAERKAARKAKKAAKVGKADKADKADSKAADGAEDGEKDGEFPALFSKDSSSPTNVTSDRLVTSNKARTLHFIGTVKAVHEGVTITCDEMKVFSSEEEDGGMEKLDSLGNVKVVTKTRVITGDRVELFDAEQKMVVTGNATLVEDGNDIAGEKIVYFYAKDDIIISGGKQQRVNMLITPQKKSEEEVGE